MPSDLQPSMLVIVGLFMRPVALSMCVGCGDLRGDRHVPVYCVLLRFTREPSTPHLEVHVVANLKVTAHACFLNWVLHVCAIGDITPPLRV
jgi:hypothetical protein